MVTSLVPPPAYPALPPPRATALRPVTSADASSDTGKRPDVEAEDLREDELKRLRPDGVHARSGHAKADAGHTVPVPDDEADEAHESPETPSFPGGMAAFMAQLFAQDEPDEEQPDPFGDASRAYQRFREERDGGHFMDVREPVDVKI